jgi:hypothetical protein
VAEFGNLPAVNSPHPSQSKLDHLQRRVERVVAATPVCDIHTHLYDPAFKQLLLWGIDDLLIYHYLVAEGLRHSATPCDRFWELPKTAQADLIWEALFVKHSPISEACRGVLTTLNRLGLDVWKRDLESVRRWFAKQTPEEYLERVLETAHVSSVHMTNSPFDNLERPVWEQGFRRDERFVAALRLDPLLLEWPATAGQLVEWGYKVNGSINRRSVDQVRRFLADWKRRIDPRYLMVSLPPDFAFPAKTTCAALLEQAILPFCEEEGLPLALMLGVQRGVNPALRLAGDGVGASDLGALRNLCLAYPNNRFLVTVLSLEDQHELCVLARKFRNLHLFGCWWFTNVPSTAEWITRMRLELLGLSFTAQHSDARVLDQLIYKWDHYRAVLVRVLTEKYGMLIESGWEPSMQEIQRDVQWLLGGAFEDFCDRQKS